MPQMQIANFICKFGRKNLADYLSEIVEPAFTDDTLIREYDSNNYFLYQEKLVNLSKSDAKYDSIIGHFVKDTELIRTQR